MHIVIHPGWQDSGPAHWQSLWQAALPNTSRVQQSNWLQPDLDTWVAGLDAHLKRLAGPAVVVCHSLGCLTLVHWAARYPQAARALAGALLVAPADVERAEAPPEIINFGPIPRQPLPFASRVVASDNDPFCELARSQQFAEDWGASLLTLPAAGHINADAGFGPWPQGQTELAALLA